MLGHILSLVCIIFEEFTNKKDEIHKIYTFGHILPLVCLILAESINKNNEIKRK